MATKKLDMKKMSAEELSKKLSETRTELRTLRFAQAGSRPADTTAPRKARVLIARILTEQNARATAEAVTA